MARRLRLLSSDRPRDGEGGFALIEVIVSAAVLAMVALAVLAGVDAAGRSTGREKAKAVAASLAEQDQERMRGIAAREVTAISQMPPFNINGAVYNVESKAEWVDDATGGTDSCSNTGAKASYIRMTTTVRASHLSSPMVISSLVEPPVSTADAGEGYLAVQVNDKDGKGVPGVAVHADGPTKDDIATNQAGCAVFGKVGVGDYNITFTRIGFVDEFGRSPGLKKTVAVTQDAKTTAAVKFDQAAPLTVSFETSNPLNQSTINSSTAYRVSATNSEAPALLTWGDGTTPLGSSPINLFPFNTAYGSIYTGSCDDADPLTVVGPGYYGSWQGPFAAKPGQAGSLKLHQPPVPLRVMRKGSSGSTPSAYDGAVVWATGTCDLGAGLERFVLTSTTTPGPSGQAGWISRTSGAYDPGLPYGTYTFCAKAGTGSNARWGMATGVTLNDPKLGRSTGVSDLVAGPTSTNPDTTKCPS